MRITTWSGLVALAAGCGAGDCPSGALDPDADAGCDCAGETYEVHDNGEVCTCGDDGLACETAATG